MSPHIVESVTSDPGAHGPVIHGRYATGQNVPYGLYLCMHPIDIRFVSATGEPLEGRPGAAYRRIPSWLAIIGSPVFGALLVLALPLVLVAILVASLVRHLHGSGRPGDSLSHRLDSATDSEPPAAPLEPHP